MNRTQRNKTHRRKVWFWREEMRKRDSKILDYVIDSKLPTEEKQRMVLELISTMSYSNIDTIDEETFEEIKREIKEKEDVQSKDTPTTVRKV